MSLERLREHEEFRLADQGFAKNACALRVDQWDQDHYFRSRPYLVDHRRATAALHGMMSGCRRDMTPS